MMKEIEIKGLCTNCKYAKNCVFLDNSKNQLNQCEEYELMPFTPTDEEVLQRISNSINELLSDSADSKTYTGLCQNCDERKKCGSTDPERVIWNCEEYV
jgi:hypothetical protein